MQPVSPAPMQPDARRAGRLSVVVPCFNEQAVIATTHRRLVDVLAGLPGQDWEIIYIDDGSRDATLALLRDIQAADPRVRVLSFSRNFGHQIAASAGLEAASGAAVVLIDADLQDPPELIPDMLARWLDGADVVYGERTARAGETRFKRLSASLFYRLINRISSTPIPIDTGDFRLMDRRVVDAVLAMPERDRFLRGMVAWTGFRQEPRYQGASSMEPVAA
jgi:polyisoprenyl-phosphate glycosyltransferase